MPGRRDGDRDEDKAVRRRKLGSIRKGEDMVKTIIAVLAAFALSSPALAQKKSCDELKGEIEAKIKKNGVEKFSLDIVEKDAQAEGKVVGTCDGGAKKIVYKRG
jgi:hypothetical protein